MTDVLYGDLVASESARRLDEYAAMFLLGYKERTREVYRQGLAQWVQFCASHQIDPLNTRRPALDAWRRDLEERGRKPSTVSHRMGAVAMFYRFLSEEEIIDRNPAAHVKRPKVPTESTTRCLSREEMMKLRWAAEAGGRPSEIALIVLLTVLGLRVSEACGIQIEDLGEERGHRTVRFVGKGDKPALMPLPPIVSRAVELARGERTSGPLILDTRGLQMNRHSAHHICGKLGRRAGIVGVVHPHTTRHGSITALLDAGVSLRDTQAFARHADPRVTARYDHGRQSLDRHASYVLSAYLAG